MVYLCVFGKGLLEKAITRHRASEEQITVYCHFMAL